MTQTSANFDVREARLFRNNRSQAVRIPAEFEFSGSRVLIHKEGDKLIIEPEPKARLLDILKGLTPSPLRISFQRTSMLRCSRLGPSICDRFTLHA
ncbi:AbrB/MazE/SpoVT family DNA-binding domain-containing protein [Sphingomonas aurantiaca]|uniref:antitoxin n=1 Tax=Sphingomonas aurantiaca TaxID=185949 RepID=UPI002FE0CD93